MQVNTPSNGTVSVVAMTVQESLMRLRVHWAQQRVPPSLALLRLFSPLLRSSLYQMEWAMVYPARIAYANAKHSPSEQRRLNSYPYAPQLTQYLQPHLNQVHLVYAQADSMRVLSLVQSQVVTPSKQAMHPPSSGPSKVEDQAQVEAEEEAAAQPQVEADSAAAGTPWPVQSTAGRTCVFARSIPALLTD